MSSAYNNEMNNFETFHVVNLNPKMDLHGSLHVMAFTSDLTMLRITNYDLSDKELFNQDVQLFTYMMRNCSHNQLLLYTYESSSLGACPPSHHV